jgi:fructosamine-3-kinase
MEVDRLTDLLGRQVTEVRPVSGGSICAAYRVQMADGSWAFAKTSRNGSPAGFFAAEAQGLDRLRAAHHHGGVGVPEVFAVADDCLVLEWVEPTRPSAEAAEAFGRRLAATHRVGAGTFGDTTGPAFIGSLPLPSGPYGAWAQLWAAGRVLPYAREARNRGALAAADAADVERAVERIWELPGADEPPSLVHGDLWSGNVLWTTADALLVDAAAVHGGHRESDLAMLVLFGLPHLDVVLAAYEAAADPPLADGWRDRVVLHQLHPVLVHAVLFGGGYGAEAGHLARQVLQL